VKVKFFRAPSPLVSTAAQARSILRGSWYLIRRRWMFGVIPVLLALVLALLLFPQDQRSMASMHSWPISQLDFARQAASFFGTWGDYLTYNVPLALGLWLYGFIAKSSTWRRLAVICFLGGTFAGIFDDCFRLTLGRPRPDAHFPDGFYGFPAALSGRFQSFPSGHAAAVFGASVALLVTHRILGLITMAFALMVVWARLELYRHYPSDIAIGSIIGICMGLLVGHGAMVRYRAKP
jgi:membrane-associated phospholipid phosphatase